MLDVTNIVDEFSNLGGRVAACAVICTRNLSGKIAATTLGLSPSLPCLYDGTEKDSSSLTSPLY